MPSTTTPDHADNIPKTSKAYKILSNAQWIEWQANGTFSGAGIDLTDGFIHLSTAHQAGETYAKFFAGQLDLVLVEVDLERVDARLVRWEPSRGGELFPHIYGELPLDAAVSHTENINRESFETLR